MQPASQQATRVVDLVTAQLTHEESEDSKASSFLSLATAARYLRGYKDESKAAKNMLATYRYRRVVQADDLGTSEATYRIVWTELEKRSMFLGALSDGDEPSSPVLIMRKRGEAFDKEDFEEYRRAFFFTLDVTAKLADKMLAREDDMERQTGQWVLVMDMAGYSSKNSPPLNVAIETLRIFQSHFPERAKRIIVLDAPRAFNMLWAIVKPLIDPVTRNKFLFTSRSIGRERLVEQVGQCVHDCIEVDLDAGKETSAGFMVSNGYLRANSE
eukprot:GFKZ01003636.1.p1 GENE.GFKZ01003636.1~~GFKZ01003636.1.p1  ORF type:complete len:271 (-),score=44.95 GFKZ01003636.1:79-891(-)